MNIVVLLPAPLWPRKAVILPSLTSMFILSTAGVESLENICKCFKVRVFFCIEFLKLSVIWLQFFWHSFFYKFPKNYLKRFPAYINGITYIYNFLVLIGWNIDIIKLLFSIIQFLNMYKKLLNQCWNLRESPNSNANFLVFIKFFKFFQSGEVICFIGVSI